MKRLLYGVGCINILLLSMPSFAQDFSNRGKDFWVAYGYHQVMTNTNGQEMVLYFATDAVTTVTVEIPGLGYSQTYANIPANTIFTSSPLPKTGNEDARLLGEGVSKKGIHITSNQPIVAYTHIYNASVSGATLLFPTPTLGKEYYSINFDQVANNVNANCWVYAIAVDSGNTAIEVIPAANTIGHSAGVPFVVDLKQGEVFNLMGVLNPGDQYRGVDLTGTKIRSIGSGLAGCKKIAVFSGSGRISVTCDGSSSSSDNYIVQAFPKNAWGRKYLTVPTKSLENNFFRVCVLDPTTIVKFNGAVLNGLARNFYYQFNTTQPGIIEADKPVMVSQVITSQGACGNGSPGDPEVIYLSPVEQSIDKVILNSTSNFAILKHWINVVMKTSATASFTLDGSFLNVFTPHPQDPAYSYAQISVGPGQHSLVADSGFNAIAYGYGTAESYGYNAGTNVKDLYQFLSIKNPFASINATATCKNTPFYFSMTFPYQPVKVKWSFGASLNAMGITDVVINNPLYDSTWMVNGKQLFRYSLPGSYIINKTATYPIKVIAQNPTPDGCSGDQEILYDVRVVERPVMDFDFMNSGCISDSVKFNDRTMNSQSIAKWYWNFDDAMSGKDSISLLTDPGHLFSQDGSHAVSLKGVSDIGCISDALTKNVVIVKPPVAAFSIVAPYCIGKNLQFIDASFSVGSNIVKWSWDFGDSTTLVTTTNNSPTHSYKNIGNYTPGLKVENAVGCKSVPTSNIINISSFPTSDFSMPDNCLKDPSSQFTDQSSINDGSGNQLTYLWNFDDAVNATATNPNTSTIKNAQHTYSIAKNYKVSLAVTSVKGCSATVTKTFGINGGSPVSAFTVLGGLEQCVNTTVTIKDNSGVDIGKLVKLEIYWEYATNPLSKTTVSYPVAGSNYTHTYPAFFSPLTKKCSIKVIAYSGTNCLQSAEETITLKAVPEINFPPVLARCADKPAFQVQANAINMTGGSGVFSGNAISASGLFDPAASESGEHMVKFTYTGTNTCVASKQQSVAIFSLPKVSAGPDKFVLSGASVLLNGKSTGAGLRYVWSPSNFLSNAFTAQPLSQPAVDLTYKLTATTADGCSASDEVNVKVLKELLVANVFSPNGDGINDTWVIEHLDTYQGATVEIFNRYGQKIFESRGYSHPWDGTYKGNQVPAGTYYYIINPGNGRKQIAGYVDILR